MITINFELKDMNGVTLNIGDTVKVYSDEAFDEDGKLIKPNWFVIGKIHWHNGSGFMWSNGIVVNREDVEKFEGICTISKSSTSNNCDENADTCWYIEKIK